MTHSPLPWSIEIEDDYTIRDANNEWLMNDACYYPSAPLQKDAEFIVKACNSYYAMTEALQLARKALEGAWAGDCYDVSSAIEAIDKALGDVKMTDEEEEYGWYYMECQDSSVTAFGFDEWMEWRNSVTDKTLRDEFAMAALSELAKVAYYDQSVKFFDEEPTEADRIARHAYLYADAMMKAREQK